MAASWVLQKHDQHGGRHGPPTRHLHQAPQARRGVGVVRAAARCRAVGQGTVEQDGVGAVDVGDANEALVELGVAAVAEDARDVVGAVVLVAAALLVFVAAALDGLGLVLARGGVVVVPGAAVGVDIDGVPPEPRPEGDGGAGKDEGDGRDAARGARAGAVGDGGAAAVVAPAAVGGGGAGAGGRAPAGGGGRGAAAAVSGVVSGGTSQLRAREVGVWFVP